MTQNFRLICNLLGILLVFNGGFMWLCLPVSFIYDESSQALLYSGLICLIVGVLAYLLTRQKRDVELRRKEGYLIVTLGWLMLSFTGMLPYLLGRHLDLTDAFFETLSGYSTTGATILTDIESLPRGLLFWRSLTQWIGGMGIIVLTVAILPILGIGGIQLFIAEAPGITPDKLKPRIKETAKRLWILYVGLTFSEMILLYIGGMDWFDAMNHALTTMATGGFSTKNASLAAFSSPFIQYTVTLFMLLAGTSFTMLYFLLTGSQNKVWRNEEFTTYLSVCLIVSLVVAGILYINTDYGLEHSVRTALFQVISIITTTGYITADYTSWVPFTSVLFFLIMFLGGSAGSTAGGVKIIRHVVLIKNSFLELKRQLHTSAILPVRLHGKGLSEHITFNVLAFIIIYILIFIAGALAVSTFGLDFVSAIGAAATCLGNIGPGLGIVGPVSNFAHLPGATKWILAFLMLLGRLELFTVLMLFTRAFWKKT